MSYHVKREEANNLLDMLDTRPNSHKEREQSYVSTFTYSFEFSIVFILKSYKCG